MDGKRCIACGEICPFSEFYRHPQMGDGTLNKCNACCRRHANERRSLKRDYVMEYDRQRFQTPERKAKVLQSQRRRREKHPEKRIAYQLVSKGLKNGTLVKLPCEACGDPNTQAHHHDYSKPLDVRWLCFKHHREIGHGQTVLAQS